MEYSRVLAIILDVIEAFTPPGVAVVADTPLLENQLLDSASVINILLELEGRLGIVIGPSDLSFDHFETPRLLAETLTERLTRE